jgi:hypothetical protein
MRRNIMRIRIKESLLLLVLMMPLVSTQLRAQNFAVAEMSDEETTATRPFTISRVESFDGGLRLFINTGDPNAVSDLLDAGSLVGQLSDHNVPEEAPVLLVLAKALICTPYSMPIYTGYRDWFPYCGCQPPFGIEYFIMAAVTLGPGRDLAIGQDPDFMWLIEEQ